MATDIQLPARSVHEHSFLGIQPPWTADDVWRDTVGSLVNFPPGLSVIELCAGAGTASIVLKMLLGQDKQVHLSGAWDISPDLAPIFRTVHGNLDNKVHLGKTRGDIMATSLASFPCANILVGGPPCPPFSSCGRRLAMADTRARPFERCIEVICELDNRRRKGKARRELMFFVLENVAGITHKVSRDKPSPLDMLLATLRERLKEQWLISAIRVNTVDYGLPHNRERVYVIGRLASLYQSYLPPAIPPVFARQVKPREFLEAQDNEPGHLTRLQSECLAKMKDLYNQAMANDDYRGCYAFVEVGRDPTDRTVWSGQSRGHVDRCQCLRASGPAIHVFALGEGVSNLSLDRPLRLHERAALQGFPAILGQLPFDEVTGRRIWGNAMSVPVLGSILAQELICLQDSLSAQRLRQAIGRPASELEPLIPEALGWAARHLAEEPDQGWPGLWDATVAWARNISQQWDRGIPGRASRPPSSSTSRKRQRKGDIPRSSSGCAAQGPRPASQPRQRGADTPATSKEELSESGGEDSPIFD